MQKQNYHVNCDSWPKSVWRLWYIGKVRPFTTENWKKVVFPFFREIAFLGVQCRFGQKISSVFLPYSTGRPSPMRFINVHDKLFIISFHAASLFIFINKTYKRACRVGEGRPWLNFTKHNFTSQHPAIHPHVTVTWPYYIQYGITVMSYCSASQVCRPTRLSLLLIVLTHNKA